MGKEQQKGLGDLREAGEKKAGKRERQGVEGWVQRGGYKKGPLLTQSCISWPSLW